MLRLSLCCLLACAFACARDAVGDFPPDGRLSPGTNTRDPTSQIGSNGAPIVDTLASTLTVDTTSTIADGVHGITVTAKLVTPSGIAAVGAHLRLQLSGTRNILSSAEVVSDKNGIASALLASKKAEMKTLSASVAGVSLAKLALNFTPGAVDAVRSHFIARPVHPAADGSTDATITLRLRDAYDNAVPAVPVTASVSGLGKQGLFSGSSGDDGNWSFALRSSVAETKRLRAAVGTLAITGGVRFVDGGGWFNTSGTPFGAHFPCLVVDASAASAVRIDVVTESGAYYSPDGGKSFLVAAAGLPLAVACRALVLDRSGTVPKLYAAFAGGAVYEKAHDEAAWTRHPDAGAVSALWLDTRHERPVLWLGRESDGLVARYDGTAWVDASSGIAPGSGVRAFAQSGDVLYAATASAVYRRGKTDTQWRALDANGEPPERIRALVVSGTTLFVGTETGVVHKNNNDPWQAEDTAWPADVCTPQPCGTKVVAMALDTSTSPARLFVASEEREESAAPTETLKPRLRARVFVRSLDSAAFVALANQAEVTHEAIEALRVAGSQLYVALARRGVFALGANAAVRLGTALRAYPPRELVVDALRADPRVFVADETGLSFSDDEGDNWQRAALGESTEAFAIAIDPVNAPGTVVVSAMLPTGRPTLWQSLDGGDTFSDISLNAASLSLLPMSALALGSDGLQGCNSEGLFAAALTGFVQAPLPTPPYPPAVQLRALLGTRDGTVLSTSGGAFLRRGSNSTRLGGDAFTKSVRRVLRTPLGAYWFATDAGVYKSADAASAAALADTGTTASRSFSSLALDDRGAEIWATASKGMPALYRFDASFDGSGVRAPDAEDTVVGEALRVGILAPALGTTGAQTKRRIFVAFDGGTGIYATSR